MDVAIQGPSAFILSCTAPLEAFDIYKQAAPRPRPRPPRRPPRTGLCAADTGARPPEGHGACDVSRVSRDVSRVSCVTSRVCLA
jgi:hypothetical protein